MSSQPLCEIATLETFHWLMTDLEIYVDRIAALRTAQMNLVLVATRQEFLRSHAPGENHLCIRIP